MVYKMVSVYIKQEKILYFIHKIETVGNKENNRVGKTMVKHKFSTIFRTIHHEKSFSNILFVFNNRTRYFYLV